MLVYKSQCDFFPLLRYLTLILFLSFTLWNANTTPSLQKHAFIHFFFKSTFKLEGKSYLQISFCKGCTRHRFDTTVGGSVGGIDKTVLCFLMLRLCRTFRRHPAVYVPLPACPLGECAAAQLWTEGPGEEENLASSPSLWSCFRKAGGNLDARDRVSNLKDKCGPSLKSEGIGLDIRTGVCIIQGVSLWQEACKRQLRLNCNLSPVIFKSHL